MSKHLSMMSIALAFMSTTSVFASNNLSDVQSSGCKGNNYSSVSKAFIEENDDEVFAVCEKMPVFEGGQEGMFGYIAKNMKYPKSALDQGITGKFYVSFIINKDGSIAKEETKLINTEDKSVKSANELAEVLVVAYALDMKKKYDKDLTEEDKEKIKLAYQEMGAEAIRVVNNMPNWTPGEQRGKKVKVRYTLPLTYRLQ